MIRRLGRVKEMMIRMEKMEIEDSGDMRDLISVSQEW
jgi:hypothetical protein